MAVSLSLSNHTVLLSPPSSVSLPYKTLALPRVTTFSTRTLRSHLPNLIIQFGFPSTSSFPVNEACCPSSFISRLAVRDPSTTTNGEEENSQIETTESREDQQPLFHLSSLIEVYKEAVLGGDEKTISEIEARIEVIENEKTELVQKVSTLKAEITSGKEKYIRLQADFDNFRKRLEKERVNIRSDAQGEVIESLLPMVDNFERAKQQIKPETEKEKKIDSSYRGIYKQFVEIMRSLRVAVVATVGKPFDPLLHEAIGREESQKFKEGIIVQELRRGFLLGDRLLRPAMVKVSSGPGRKKATPAEVSAGSAEVSAGPAELTKDRFSR